MCACVAVCRDRRGIRRGSSEIVFSTLRVVERARVCASKYVTDYDGESNKKRTESKEERINAMMNTSKDGKIKTNKR